MPSVFSFAALPLVVVATAWACTPAALGATARSDEDLVALRAAHAAELDELRGGLAAEAVTCIGVPSAGDCDDGGGGDAIPSARLARYRADLASLGAARARRGPADTVVVTFGNGGKSLVWSGGGAPGHVVRDTDEDTVGARRTYGVVYARAGGGWYIQAS